MAVKKELRAVISAEDRAYQRTMARVKKTAMDVGQSLVKIGLAGGVAFLAGTKIAADYADEIDKTSQRLGLTIEQYQRLKVAAAQAGMSTEQFAVGMQALSKNLGAALQGEQGQIKALRAMGLSLRDIRGKDAVTQLMQVGNALSRITDRNKQMKLAGQLFGDEAGARLMVLFAKGAAGVADAMDRIDGKSLLTVEQVQAATQLNDQLTVTKAILMGGLARLLADTWPVLQEGIRNATSELEGFMGSADFDSLRGDLLYIVTEMALLGKEIIPLVKTGLEGLAGLNAFAKPIEGLTMLLGLLNEWNAAVAKMQNDGLEKQDTSTGGRDASPVRRLKDFKEQTQAGAQRLLMGDLSLGDGAGNLGNVATAKAVEGAAASILEFLSKGPLNEGR